MIKLGFSSANAFYELRGKDNAIYDRVAETTEVLLKALSRLEDFAKPKAFVYSGANLLEFKAVPIEGYPFKHRVQVSGFKLIDEITRWQIFGHIGGKTANVVVEYIFHTHIGNRSGSGEYFMNGKDMGLKAELGGISIDDIWQDSEKWKPYAKQGLYIINQGDIIIKQ